MKNIFVNLQNIKFDGNVIDISVPGNSIIPEIIKSIEEYSGQVFEKDYFIWEKEKSININNNYDYAVAFFSFNKLLRKKNAEILIKNIRDILKNNGTLMIWDIDSTNLGAIVRYNIKVLLPEDKRGKMKITMFINPFRIKFYGILKLLKKNGFTIVNSRLSNSVFYIEARNEKEVLENEDSNGRNQCEI